jgi:hypothetical protein
MMDTIVGAAIAYQAGLERDADRYRWLRANAQAIAGMHGDITPHMVDWLVDRFMTVGIARTFKEYEAGEANNGQ